MITRLKYLSIFTSRLFMMNILSIMGFALIGMINASPICISFSDSAVVVGSSACLREVATVSGAAPKLARELENVVVVKSLLPELLRICNTRHIVGYCRRHWPKQIFRFKNEGCIVIRRDSRKVHAKEIKRQVMSFIFRNMPWPREDVDIRFTRCPEEVTLPNLPYHIKVEKHLDFNYKGTGKLYVLLLQGDKAVKTASVSAEIQVCRNVCVAGKSIKRNAVVSRSDIVVKKMNITRVPHGFFTEPRAIIGMRARRTIKKGRLVDETMVESPPAVVCGSAVRIFVRKGKATIEAEGISRSDGRVGERIPVTCLATRRILKGHVQADGSVLLGGTQ